MKKICFSLKNKKGFTLVELLAVIVILGIIAAIAVPSIGKVIQNAKDDSDTANEQMVKEAARLAYTNGLTLVDTNNDTTDDIKGYLLSTLQNNGYLDSSIKNPNGGTYNSTNSYVNISVDGNNKATYTVHLE